MQISVASINIDFSDNQSETRGTVGLQRRKGGARLELKADGAIIFSWDLLASTAGRVIALQQFSGRAVQGKFPGRGRGQGLASSQVLEGTT